MLGHPGVDGVSELRVMTVIANPKRMQGLTLIEAMVAITISLILLSGAITLFINNKVAYETNDNLSRLQENARFAIDFIIEDLRMAGYFGCRNSMDSVNNSIVAAAGDGTLEDTLNPLEGFDDSSLAWSPSGNTDTTAVNILANTDAITVRRLSGTNVVVTDASPGQLTVEDSTGLAVNDLVGVSDCGGADLFQITGLAGNVISHGALAREYISNGDANDSVNPIVSTFVGVRYYIGTDDNGDPALFREVLGPGIAPLQQQLIDGVESMHIIYGVDTDNDNVPDTYVPAGDDALDSNTEWGDVIAVRLSLLMRTTRPYGDPQDVGDINYQLTDDTFVVPDDVINVPDDDTARRYKRRVFNTTVLLRNRLT